MTTATKTRKAKATTKKQDTSSAADELRQTLIAVRLMTTKPGQKLTLTLEQKNKVAKQFDTTREAIGGNKKLYARGDKYIGEIRRIITLAKQTWRLFTIPHPSLDGVRLLPVARLAEFEKAIDALKKQLSTACLNADAHRDIILSGAEKQLKKLYREGDYPESWVGDASIEWHTENFEPDERLLKNAPAFYKREQRRVREMLEESLVLYQVEMREEMTNLVQGMLDKLEPEKEGEKPKLFREATANNVRNFIERFESIGICNDADTAKLIKTLRESLGDTKMSTLKDDSIRREQVKESFTAIKASIDKLPTIDAGQRMIDLSELDD